MKNDVCMVFNTLFRLTSKLTEEKIWRHSRKMKDQIKSIEKGWNKLKTHHKTRDQIENYFKN